MNTVSWELCGELDGGCSHAGTVPLVVCHHNKPSKALIKALPVAFLESKILCYDASGGGPSAERFAPVDLEHLSRPKPARMFDDIF